MRFGARKNHFFEWDNDVQGFERFFALLRMTSGEKTAYQVGDARRENFASTTSGARPHIKRFFANAQNDRRGKDVQNDGRGKERFK